jgi:TPR repeat protein
MKLATKLALGLVALSALPAVMIAGAFKPVADPLNAAGVSLVHAGLHWPARKVYSYLAGFDHINAVNNLGVMELRGLGGPANSDSAWLNISRASQRGVVAARYNEAFHMSNRSNTADRIIRNRLRRLHANVKAGDVHSAVVLANTLYYKNREKFVPNREARIVELLEMAAATGDRDYIYQAGKWMFDNARSQTPGDAALAARAVEHMLKAFELGDHRAAKTLAFMMTYDGRLVSKEASPGLYVHDEQGWLRLAAGLGSLTAPCSFGINVMRDINWYEAESEPPVLEPAVLEKLSKTYPETVNFLARCAAARELEWPDNPPFGSPALYVQKAAGSQTSLTSQGTAALYLGRMYEDGMLVPKDLDKAREYFELALSQHKMRQAKAAIDRLKTPAAVAQ